MWTGDISYFCAEFHPAQLKNFVMIRRVLQRSFGVCSLGAMLFSFTASRASQPGAVAVDSVHGQSTAHVEGLDSADVGNHEGHEGHHGEAFEAGEFIVNHISDAHDIHLFGDVHIPLPVILHVAGHGWDVFMSSALEGHGHGDKHGVGALGVPYTLHGAEKEVMVDGVPTPVLAGTITADNGAKVLDFSITKSVFGMLLMMALMLYIFVTMARGYARNPNEAPKGLSNALEPLILFIRDEVAHPALGHNTNRFMPFLLSVFFFIFFSNLLGLIPFIGGFNITGTLGVTLVMATMVFLITSFSGNKHYWGHVLWMPGVLWPIKALILTPIEIIGIFLKPAVLMIRLTANITAGHIIILAFTSLIFILGKHGEAPAVGMGVGVFSTLFMVFMYCLELLVAFLQAYVFTLLAALYFGDAKQEAHH